MKPLIIGHRGAAGEKPENTIDAFQHAARLGIPIETDIAMTADLIPVMHHNPTLPNGRPIRDLPYAALKNIPTLTESLNALPNQIWYLEIKTYPLTPEKSHPPAAIVTRILQILAETKTDPSRIGIKAFDWEVLREFARQSPNIHRIALTAPDTEAARDQWWGRGLDHLTTPQAVAATGAQTWSAFNKTLTQAQIHQARQLGLQVFAWTINTPADFARLAPLVDGIVTDFPSRYVSPAR